MTSAGDAQTLSAINQSGELHTTVPPSSDEPSDANSFGLRPATATNHQRVSSRETYIPPAVPSPPSRTISPPPAPAQLPHPKLTPYRAYAMPAPEHLAISAEQWLFSAQEINTSPSIDHGISGEEERTRRAKGVNFIYQAGILLKMPQITLQTAAVFLHRFYMRYSMVQEKGGIHHYVRTPGASLPRSKAGREKDLKDQSKGNSVLTGGTTEQNIAATALFLASKAEETCRKTKEIVVAVARVAQKNAALIIDEQSKEFWRWRDNILAYEETMLELLTFDVVLTSPYHLLRAHLEGMDLVRYKTLRDAAWSFLNDSAMTTLCLRMPPRDIAVAAIYFGTRVMNVRIPDDEEDKPWWHRLGGRSERIAEAVEVMAQFYNDNPLNKPDSELDNSPGSADEDLEKSRLRNGAVGGGALTPESFGKGNSVDGRNGNGRGGSVSASVNGSLVNDDSQSQSQGRNQQNGYHHSQAVKATGKEQTAEQKVKLERESREAERKEVIAEAKADAAPGDSDAALKEVANDPATHELSAASNANGVDHINGNKKRSSPSGHADSVEEINRSKRPRTDDNLPRAAPVNEEKNKEDREDVASEEGELEE